MRHGKWLSNGGSCIIGPFQVVFSKAFVCLLGLDVTSYQSRTRSRHSLGQATVLAVEVFDAFQGILIRDLCFQPLPCLSAVECRWIPICYLKRFTTHASNLFNYTHIIPITYPSHTHTITCHIQETERNRSLLPSACHQPGSVPGPLRDHG